jgi:predicted DNA-binding protein (UPF0251 family)
MRQTLNCKICGVSFSSFNPNPQFCTKECKAKSQIANIDNEKAIALYASGLTLDEVAERLGVTEKAITNLMKRAGQPRRKAVVRDRRGDKCYQWKGDKATYKSLHCRLYRNLGTPKKCETCGTDDPNKRYEWANQTGNYADMSDYKRMCCSCHRRFDNSRRKAKLLQEGIAI